MHVSRRLFFRQTRRLWIREVVFRESRCSFPAPRGSDYLTATAAALFKHCAHFFVAMCQAKAHHKEARFRGSDALSPRDHGQHAIMAPVVVLQEMCDDVIAVSSHGQCRRMVDNMLEKMACPTVGAMFQNSFCHPAAVPRATRARISQEPLREHAGRKSG